MVNAPATPKNPRMPAGGLDDIDLAIVAELAADARITNAALAVSGCITVGPRKPPRSVRCGQPRGHGSARFCVAARRHLAAPVS